MSETKSEPVVQSSVPTKPVVPANAEVKNAQPVVSENTEVNKLPDKQIQQIYGYERLKRYFDGCSIDIINNLTFVMENSYIQPFVIAERNSFYCNISFLVNFDNHIINKFIKHNEYFYEQFLSTLIDNLYEYDKIQYETMSKIKIFNSGRSIISSFAKKGYINMNLENKTILDYISDNYQDDLDEKVKRKIKNLEKYIRFKGGLTFNELIEKMKTENETIAYMAKIGMNPLMYFKTKELIDLQNKEIDELQKIYEFEEKRFNKLVDYQKYHLYNTKNIDFENNINKIAIKYNKQAEELFDEYYNKITYFNNWEKKYSIIMLAELSKRQSIEYRVILERCGMTKNFNDAKEEMFGNKTDKKFTLTQLTTDPAFKTDLMNIVSQFLSENKGLIDSMVDAKLARQKLANWDATSNCSDLDIPKVEVASWGSTFETVDE